MDLLQMLGRRVDVETAGAWFVSHVPWVAPLAYLHVVFKPGSQENVERSRVLPADFGNMVRRYNGFDLFQIGGGSALSMYGSFLVTTISRSPKLDAVTPYDVFDYNGQVSPDRPAVIGSYFADGSEVVLNPDGTVYRRSLKGHQLSGAWNTIEEWVTCEIARLEPMFTADGHYLGTSAAATLP